MVQTEAAAKSTDSGPIGELEVLSASDIERFGYCPLNWWQKRKGAKESDKNLESGITHHEKIAKDIGSITERETFATRSQIGILWFAIIAILLGINGAAIVYFRYITMVHKETISFVLLVISILWIAIAVIFFVIAFFKDILVSRRKALSSVTGSETSATSDDEVSKIKKPGVAIAGTKVSAADGTPITDSLQTDTLSSKLPKLDWKTMAVWFIIVAVALALNGFMLEYPFAEPGILSRILLSVALLWLIGTSIILFFALRIEERMKRIDKGEMGDQYLKFYQSYSRSEKLMLAFAAGAAILGITGFIVQYREVLTPLDLFGQIFLVLSLVWMSAGFLFFYKSFWGGFATQKISSEILSALVSDTKKPISLKKHLEAIEKGKIMSEEYGVLSMAVLATVLGINSILVRLPPTEIFTQILEIVALIWLIGASFFLYDVLKHLEIAKGLREFYKLGKASIEYTDLMDDKTKILQSDRYKIRGRPDYILKNNSDIIPVEVKTGRVPRGPHFSHILQLAAYFVLVEENFGQRPPYGLIRYGKEKEVKIDYDKKLEDLILNKITEMRQCVKSGTAHRNHRRKNKCIYCSRRQSCPERLA
jgi:CRISPR-associated exonuclease Cas4